MKLYLLRHGHAPSTADAGVAYDRDRPLSEAGRAAVKKTVALLLERGGRPSLVLHSPLRRAAETAREAAALLTPAGGLELFEPLSNAEPAPELLAHLTARAGAAAEVLAVGHQPQLGELAAFLTSKIFELRPGGLIVLELAGGKARALWTANPQDGPIG